MANRRPVIEAIQTTTSNTLTGSLQRATCAAPAGIQAGELLVIIAFFPGLSSISVDDNSWTEHIQYVRPNTAVFFKTAIGNEGDVLLNLNGGTDTISHGRVFHYLRISNAAGLESGAGSGESVGATFTAQGVASNFEGGLAFACGGVFSDTLSLTLITTPTWTEVANDAVGGASGKNIAGAVATYDCEIETTPAAQFSLTGSEYRSWVQFVVTSIDSGVVEPPDGPFASFKDEVDADLLYAEAQLLPTMTGPEGILGVYGREIMANVGGFRIIYSFDRGQSWLETGFVPGYSEGYRVNKIVQNPSSGYWYILVENAGDRVARIYRSPDAGATWVQMSSGNVNNYTSGALIIDAEGRLLSAGRDAGGIRLRRWDDPDNSTTAGTTYILEGTGNNNVDNLQENGDFYIVNVALTSTARVFQVPKTMDATVQYDANLNTYDYAPWTKQWSRPVDGRLYNFFLRGEAGGNIAQYDSFYVGSPVPLALVESDYAFDIQHPRLAVAPTYLSFGITDQINSNVQYHQLFSDPDLPAQKQIRVNMPSSAGTTQRVNYYHSEDNYFIGAYVTVDGFVNIVGFAYTEELVTVGARGALVYNYEDDNFTWADASVEEASTLNGVTAMGYFLEPGWSVRWSDLEGLGTTWQELTSRNTRWSDFYYMGTEKDMYWLTTDGLYKADQEVVTSGFKEYYVERLQIDFDDIVPSFTSNVKKYMRQWYFHMVSYLPSDFTGANTFDFQVGWSDNLMDDPVWQNAQVVELNRTENKGKVKLDFRSTGRYLSVKFDFSKTYGAVVTGADVDVEESYGR